MAHGADVVVAHRLHVHQRAAVVEVELAVVVVDDPEAEVQELERRTDVELDVLERRLHRVALEAEEALGALRVDRARAHPLVDGDVAHHLHAVGDHLRHPGAVDELPAEQQLPQERGELQLGEVVEGSMLRHDQAGSEIDFVSRYPSRPSRPSSRPMPLAFIPPNGAPGSML